MSSFDPVKYKQTTEQQWQDAAEAWHRWGPTLGAWLGPATEEMLRMARIGPGSRVLDVTAECRQYKGGSLVNKPLRGGPCRAFTNPGGLWNGSLALYGRMPGGLDPT